jgi:hypothetical protein
MEPMDFLGDDGKQRLNEWPAACDEGATCRLYTEIHGDLDRPGLLTRVDRIYTAAFAVLTVWGVAGFMMWNTLSHMQQTVDHQNDLILKLTDTLRDRGTMSHELPDQYVVHKGIYPEAAEK